MNALIRQETFELLNDKNDVFLIGRIHLQFDNEKEVEEFLDLFEKGVLLGKRGAEKGLTSEEVCSNVKA